MYVLFSLLYMWLGLYWITCRDSIKTIANSFPVSDGYHTDSSMSPSIPFISAVQSPCSSLPPLHQSPTPTSSVSEWQDAQSDILVDKENFADDVDGDVLNYPLMTFGMTKRRLSRTPSGSQRSRKVPDLEDIEFPSLDYGPHLKFFPEEFGKYHISCSSRISC